MNIVIIKNVIVGIEFGLFINGFVDMVFCNLLVDIGVILIIFVDRIFENMEKVGCIFLEIVV